MIRAHPVFLVFFFAGSIFLESCGQARREVAATVFQTEGEFSIDGDRSSSGLAHSQERSRLHVGDRLRTNAAASIDFAAVPGTLVRLGDNSELLIENLSVTKDGHGMVDAMKSRDVRLRLIRGILSIVIGEAGRNTRTLISTPAGHFFADSGSTFQLNVIEGKTRATCVRGKVILQTEKLGLNVGIGAGYVLDWPAKTAVPQLAAESDAETQTEVAMLLEVERNLLSLQERERAKPLRRDVEDEPGILEKKNSKQHLLLFLYSERNRLRKSLWFRDHFFGGNDIVLPSRFEPGFS